MGLTLYAILKLRYRRPVIRPLGWLVPSKIYIATSILDGVIAALAITYVTHTRGLAMPTIPAKDFFVLGFLPGPVLEELYFADTSLTRALGSGVSVLAVAILFAAFHSPRRRCTLAVVYRDWPGIRFPPSGIPNYYSASNSAYNV